MELFVTNAGDRIYVHSMSSCRGSICPIHKPTDHHMRNWKMIWRYDRKIFERLCPEHDTGHPDPDDFAAREVIFGKTDGVHGCCGCCWHPGGSLTPIQESAKILDNGGETL